MDRAPLPYILSIQRWRGDGAGRTNFLMGPECTQWQRESHSNVWGSPTPFSRISKQIHNKACVRLWTETSALPQLGCFINS